jgi:hypothetical protein
MSDRKSVAWKIASVDKPSLPWTSCPFSSFVCQPNNRLKDIPFIYQFFFPSTQEKKLRLLTCTQSVQNIEHQTKSP